MIENSEENRSKVARIVVEGMSIEDLALWAVDAIEHSFADCSETYLATLQDYELRSQLDLDDMEVSI